MSHIFDALQKSVAEQAESEAPSSLLATELLETAERKAAAARARIAVADEPGMPMEIAEIAERLKFPLGSPASAAAVMQAAGSPEPAREAPIIDQFSQFQTLRVLVPPQSRLVCVTERDSLAAEKFRYLGVRLRQMQQTRLLKKLLITSTIPQEGKSMVAANLACALAQKTQQKTVLIEGDLRRPSVAKLFGLGKIPGISEWLAGEGSARSSIYHLDEPGLWVLPAGNVPRNPLELMQSGRLSALMEQLSSWFDWVVIDSPPVLPLADTSIWMRNADGILLVARQAVTERDHLKRGIEAIDNKKLLGVVLNSSTDTKNNYYYSHYAAAVPAERSAADGGLVRK
jgi:capsular exopolysaccharide synthesis family protein